MTKPSGTFFLASQINQNLFCSGNKTSSLIKKFQKTHPQVEVSFTESNRPRGYLTKQIDIHVFNGWLEAEKVIFFAENPKAAKKAKEVEQRKNKAAPVQGTLLPKSTHLPAHALAKQTVNGVVRDVAALRKAGYEIELIIREPARAY